MAHYLQFLLLGTEVKKMAEKSDYKRSDFHYESCSSPFCNGCKSYTGESENRAAQKAKEHRVLTEQEVKYE